MTLSSVQIFAQNLADRDTVSSLLGFFSIESQDGSDDTQAASFSSQITAFVCEDHQEFSTLFNSLPEVEQKKPALLFYTGEKIQEDNKGKEKIFPLPLKCTHQQLNKQLNQANSALTNNSRRRRQSLQSLEGSSAGIEKVKQLIEKVANTDANVLILGESGTGKELVARAIHRLSDRADGTFVPVNCGAIPKDLLESELFGHEKGAFTGAISARKGRFEMAEGGTLFLDEIGDMDIAMQVKLLRVLQEKTFERVGSSRSLKANVRIVAATHRNLEQAIADGKFREDLFYRLNVFPIEMPPLRERREDVPALAHSMIQRLAKEQGSYALNQESLNALINHDWPGNVRELANLIERLRILYPDQTIRLEDLPANYSGNFRAENIPSAATLISPTNMNTASMHLSTGNFNLKDHLQEIELEHIKEALSRSNGVVAAAAKLLNLRRTTLVEKMRKLQIEREEMMS